MEKQSAPNRKGMCAGHHPNGKGEWPVEENASPTPRKVHEKVPSGGALRNPHRSVFHGCITNNHRLRDVKHPLISSQCCQVQVQHGTAGFSAQPLVRLCCQVEPGILCHIHPSWGWNSASYDGRTGVPFPSAWPTPLKTRQLPSSRPAGSHLLLLVISFKHSPDLIRPILDNRPFHELIGDLIYTCQIPSPLLYNLENNYLITVTAVTHTQGKELPRACISGGRDIGDHLGMWPRIPWNL